MKIQVRQFALFDLFDSTWSLSCRIVRVGKFDEYEVTLVSFTLVSILPTAALNPQASEGNCHKSDLCDFCTS